MTMHVIDAHVHFWDPSVLRYPWLDSHPDLNAPFLPVDFSSFGSQAVQGAIFVEANCAERRAGEELALVNRLATAEPRIVGIVGFVDMLDEAARIGGLERLRASGRAVGVRHNIQGHPAGFATQSAFARGVQEVGRFGLVFDLCVTAGQIREARALVEKCPGTQFVLDHCGKPVIRQGAFDAWAADLSDLSRMENVSCKLSGLMTEADENHCTFDGLYPFAAHALECFGTKRLLYGSDWPVCTSRGGDIMWRAFTDRFTATWSPDERADFYANNAMRIYTLSPADA